MIKQVIFLLTLLFSTFTLTLDNTLTIGEVNLVVLSIIIVLDYTDKKSLSLFQVWQVGFIFIILSEIILIDANPSIVKASKYLIIANYLIILGYSVPLKTSQTKKLHHVTNTVKASKWTPIILIIMIIGYVIYALPEAILSYTLGRNAAAAIIFTDRNLIVSSFFGALSLVLPSIIMFYFKEIVKRESLIIPLLLSIPIFIILFIGGTRFPLLFSFGGFLIVSQASGNGRIELKVKLIIFLLLLVSSSFIMAQFRSRGLSSFESTSTHTLVESRLSTRIASEMSPEGVVDMTSLMMTYFDENPHTYGKSISFLTYFWVPRAIWPEKPTMLGHWLIRKYRTGYSEGHSSSFGFTGELFADFGYFSLFFVFLLGIALKWADQFRAFHLAQPRSYQKILVGMLFSYVFFFVRSPITSTMTFLGILLVYYLIKKMLFKDQKLNKQFES